MPKVSVIIPTYKRRNLILATLESVFAQSYTDFEVIVVNDGSPDDTRDVLSPLAESGRIIYIEKENGGQASARNRGLAEAQGEYLAFLDDDDLWPADKLQWQADVLDADPECVLVHGDAQFFSEREGANTPSDRQYGKRVPEGGAPSGKVWQQLISENYIQSPGQVLVRATAAKNIGGFDTNIWGTEDYDFHLCLARKGTFRYIPRIALLYRFHAVSTTRNTIRMYNNVAKVRRKQLGLFPRPQTASLWLANYRYTSRVWGDDFVNATGDAIRNGDKRRARSLWLRAVLLRPAFLGRRHTYFLLKNLL